MEKISEIKIVCQAIALSGQKSNGAMDVKLDKPYQFICSNSHIVHKFFVFCVSFLCGCVTALSIHIYPRN